MAISSSQEQIPFRTLREVSAAAFTASFVSILLNPFDVVKVKLQTQNQRGANQQHLKKLSTTASPQQGLLCFEDVAYDLNNKCTCIISLAARAIREYSCVVLISVFHTCSWISMKK